MTEPIRAKIHIWGPDKSQKVIFIDELEHYEEKGWRDHPNKVGKPVERVVPRETIDIKAPKKRGRPKMNQDDTI